MKRKRKRKLSVAAAWREATLELTWHGFSRGMIFGGLYGVLWFLSWAGKTDPQLMPGWVLAAMCLPLPIGAAVGMIVGLVLGTLNGLAIGLLTSLLFVPTSDGKLYRFCIGAFSIVFTLASGVVIFSVVFSESPSVYFFLYAVVPPLIAAIVLGHASQRAARWYLAALTTDEGLPLTTRNNV